MFKWTPYVMVRICLFFAAGILLAIYQPDFLDESITTYVLIGLVVVYVTTSVWLSQTKAIRVVSGVVGLLALFLFGYIQLLVNTESRKADHLLYLDQSITYYEAVVRSAPESKAKSWKLEVELQQVKTNEWKQVTGKVLLYLSKAKFPNINWNYGDRILIKGSPRQLPAPANPHEFDYLRFLSFRNIYHQQYVSSGDDVHWLGEPSRKGFMHYSILARAWAREQINRFVEGEQSQAIAQALVLGVTEGIDTDLQSAYAASGAMHVLAVSGLHVGIIYGILLFLMRPLNRFAWSRWVVFVVSIICLWSFAFVTGLSPSVLRAVTMFSFIALARPLGWKSNIYNTLAGSAFLLLLYNPYLIMSVGFQLSYLAVLGIVYLQRPIYNLWEIDNRVGDWVWQITCVSIAAQASTFALGMLYFHQFPVYFLISNLFVIPLSTIILVVGIFLLLISQVAWLAGFTGLMVTYLINALNWIVFEVERWPFSLIEEIHITTFQCWLIMVFLMGIALLIEFRTFQWLYVSGFALVVLLFTQWEHYELTTERKQFVVYSVNGHHAMEWIDAGKSYFHADSTLKHDAERIRFHIRPNRLNSGVSEINHIVPFSQRFQEGAILYRWRNNTILHWQRAKETPPVQTEVDYLVVSKNSFNLDHISNIKCKTVILDGTNSRFYVNKWKAVAAEQNFSVYSVLDMGAFILIQ